MTAKSVTEEVTQEEIVDNLTETKDKAALEEQVDMSVLANLKAKAKKKEQEQQLSNKIIAKKPKSLVFGIVGTGQCGSRLAETFAGFGYEAVAINTAQQDLKSINLLDGNKLLLPGTLGGCAKTLDLGAQVADANRDQILELVDDKLGASQVLILCTSLGGGSGAGSFDVMVDVLSQTGKPIVCVCALPGESDDAQTKANSLETLAKLAAAVKSGKISNAVVVDNAKIETIFHDVNQMDFFGKANHAIVAPIDAFNSLSMESSSVKALDSSEFTKILLDGGGLSVYGEITISSNLEEDTAIASAIIDNLEGNLLASGFKIDSAKYVGVCIVASPETWKKIPNSSVGYGISMISDKCSNPVGIFKGVYSVPMNDDEIKVYTFLSGLSLPTSRIDQLKKDTQAMAAANKSKDAQRTLDLTVDTGSNDTTSQAQKIKERIASKSSAFGKLMGGGTIDRRKK